MNKSSCSGVFIQDILSDLQKETKIMKRDITEGANHTLKLLLGNLAYLRPLQV